VGDISSWLLFLFWGCPFWLFLPLVQQQWITIPVEVKMMALLD
jgi:hypothetical protein